MIASLRDAEIALEQLKLDVNKLKVQSSSTSKLSKVELIDKFRINQVSGFGTSSGDIPNYTPNTTEVPIPKEVIYDTSSSLAGLPTGLGTEDQGQQYYNSYFKRYWFWDGAAWHYNDSGIGAGGQCTTSSSAIPPEGGLWQLCDGSTVSCALDNATIGNKIASPAQATGGNNPIIQGGTGDTTQHGATAPTLNLSVAIGIGSLSVDSATGTGTALTGVGAIAGGSHSHGLSGNPSVTQQPTINAPTDSVGLGLRVSMAWWMRR